jgi:hypothetical protein
MLGVMPSLRAHSDFLIRSGPERCDPLFIVNQTIFTTFLEQALERSRRREARLLFPARKDPLFRRAGAIPPLCIRG